MSRQAEKQVAAVDAPTKLAENSLSNKGFGV